MPVLLSMSGVQGIVYSNEVAGGYGFVVLNNDGDGTFSNGQTLFASQMREVVAGDYVCITVSDTGTGLYAAFG